MRLSEREKTAICAAILSLDPQAKTYLYGSRANDNLKGGDIDLIVLSESLTFSDKLSILVQIKQVLGEQKIDLSISSQGKLAANPFISEALKNAVEL